MTAFDLFVFGGVSKLENAFRKRQSGLTKTNFVLDMVEIFDMVYLISLLMITCLMPVCF